MKNIEPPGVDSPRNLKGNVNSEIDTISNKSFDEETSSCPICDYVDWRDEHPLKTLADKNKQKKTIETTFCDFEQRGD